MIYASTCCPLLQGRSLGCLALSHRNCLKRMLLFFDNLSRFLFAKYVSSASPVPARQLDALLPGLLCTPLNAAVIYLWRGHCQACFAIFQYEHFPFYSTFKMDKKYIWFHGHSKVNNNNKIGQWTKLVNLILHRLEWLPRFKFCQFGFFIGFLRIPRVSGQRTSRGGQEKEIGTSLEKVKFTKKRARKGKPEKRNKSECGSNKIQ